MNLVTDALRAIDNRVWLRAALADAAHDRPLVFDSMRFALDYDYLNSRDFSLWKIDAPLALRLRRLEARGQVFDPSADESHAAEIELADHEFDVTIYNDTSTLAELHALIDRTVGPDGHL
jgi:hypothetical protein